MLEILDKIIWLLILSLLTNTETTKLSDQKKCGDPECETAVSRVQAIKDHTGPDCRFLSFKTGAEIMVHFKLSRTREDLWAGSTGQDFGYFPVEAIRVEEVLTTQEVEVPTKETDFFCFDGGEYIFENEDGLFNHDDEETESIPLYRDEDDSVSEALKQRESSFGKELKEPFSDNSEVDSKSKDRHPVETASYGDGELGSSKAGQDETIQQEDPGSQSLTKVPTQLAWTVPGIASWFGLGSKQNEEAAGKTSEATGPIVFRHRKLAITDDSDLKKLTDEDSEPKDVGWFPRSLPEFLNFGSENVGLGVLHKENDPENQGSSTTTDHDGSAAASETSKEGPRRSEELSPKWFSLDLQDVLTFGYSTENKVRREKYTDGTTADQKEPQPLSSPLTETSVDEGSRKLIVESVLHKEHHKRNCFQGTAGNEAEGTYAEMHPAHQLDPGFRTADTSSSPEGEDKKTPSQYAEQNSISDCEVMGNSRMETIGKESGRKNDQSGVPREALAGSAPQEKRPVKSDHEPSSCQHCTILTIPSGNIEGEAQTSLKNGQFTVKGPSRRSRPVPKNSAPSSGGERPVRTGFGRLEAAWIGEQVGRPRARTRGRGSPAPPRHVRRRRKGRDSRRAASADGEMASGAAAPGSDAAVPAEEARRPGWRDGLGLLWDGARTAAAALPESLRPAPDLRDLPRGAAVCGAALAVLALLLLARRGCRSVRSRLYAGREKQLAGRVAELLEDKCSLLEKLRLCRREFEELEGSLKDTSLLKGLSAPLDIKTLHEELISSNSALESEIECLGKELEEEKVKQLEQDELLDELQKKMESFKNEAYSVELQVAEAKNTLKVYEISRERVKKSLQDAIAENGHLKESEKQLLQEVEGWGERFSELSEQTKMLESSKADMEEALKNKERQVKSLTECLLKMTDWSSATGERHAAEGNHFSNDRNAETENRELSGDQEKQIIRELIHAAKLSARLKSLETERNQIHSKLTDENKAKEELLERIESLQKEHELLLSENAHFENEAQKLQQKLKVMTELYQENEMNLHRKLTVEEKERLQKEEKLSKVDEKMNHAAEELNTYRQRAKDLEEELERTVRSYQSQIMSHQKKAHDNWLAARAAERFLNDLKKENSDIRQKLTEAEFTCSLLEKDPYALDVPVRPYVREHSPYGPSPMGRPSSETRAFLSPPTLLEGPLRLSPVLPGGGRRGPRGLDSSGINEAGNERDEMNSDRFPDRHRPPSDTGSLSPPWDRDRRIISPPSGQSYNEPLLPIRRPERLYSNPPNSGRLSGPADLRSYSMHSLDKADSQVSENNSRMDLSGNGTKDNLNENDVLGQPLPAESESFGSRIVPPLFPWPRAPLMPVDPRGPFLRRGSPFPPVPPPTVYGPREFSPRNFENMPHPPVPVRGLIPVRPFSQYPPPRAEFFPPPSLDNRSELPAELTQPPTVPSADPQGRSQEET